MPARTPIGVSVRARVRMSVGKGRHSTARRNTARHGLTWPSTIRHGPAQNGGWACERAGARARGRMSRTAGRQCMAGGRASSRAGGPAGWMQEASGRAGKRKEGGPAVACHAPTTHARTPPFPGERAHTCACAQANFTAHARDAAACPPAVTYSCSSRCALGHAPCTHARARTHAHAHTDAQTHAQACTYATAHARSRTHPHTATFRHAREQASVRGLITKTFEMARCSISAISRHCRRHVDCAGMGVPERRSF